MSKDRNTFAKRQREVERKRKADEKRSLRRKKKERGPAAVESDPASDAEEAPAD